MNGAPGASGRTRVVVVEDNPDNLALMVALLERRYDVVACDDPLQAVKTVEHHRPDVVLLDIGLPLLDGPSILDLIRARPEISGTAVVAVTADVRRDSREFWVWRGFDDYLAKPIVDKTALWAIVDALTAEVPFL